MPSHCWPELSVKQRENGVERIYREKNRKIYHKITVSWKDWAFFRLMVAAVLLSAFTSCRFGYLQLYNGELRRHFVMYGRMSRIFSGAAACNKLFNRITFGFVHIKKIFIRLIKGFFFLINPFICFIGV